MSAKPDDHDLEGWARLYARQLNRRCWRWPYAIPSYELMTGSLLWPDEPLLFAPTPVAWALRPLLAYRTWLALPDKNRAELEATDFEPFDKYWDLCRSLFPNWVGFHPARRKWGRREMVIYRVGNIGMIRCLREAENEL